MCEEKVTMKCKLTLLLIGSTVNKILQEKTAIVIDNCAVYFYIKRKTRGNTMNEYIPNGYTNWTEYNRAMASKEKRNYIFQGIFGMVVFFGLIFLDGFINLQMGL